MAQCANCQVCQTSQRQRATPCGPINDRSCIQCPVGNIVTGSALDTCTQCAGGTYADNANNRCLTCQTCARTHRQTGACTSASNRACEACTNNRVTSETNSQFCSLCRKDYYDTQGSTVANEPNCAVCAGSACSVGSYVVCTTSADGWSGYRECRRCQGHQISDSTPCTQHMGVATACSGAGTTAVNCENCPAGTERPAGSPWVSVTENGVTINIQKCLPCGTGKFKASASNQACGDCTNKPENSAYVSWGTDTPSTSSCPWCVAFSGSGWRCD